MEYLVTIIMSNYNQEKTIRRAIDSIFEQKTNFDWQIIITDDNSVKDNSKDIIKEYAEKYPDKIKALYSDENGGYLKNVLRAKRLTKTKYFCLLDADDYWTDKKYMQKAVNFLEKHKDYTVYYQNVLCVLENGESYPYNKRKNVLKDYSIEDYFYGNVFIPQTTGSFFRNVIFENGIPKLMEKAENTISNLSYEGDHARYLMHLKYGKAHYCDEISGVYNITSDGIWSRLSAIDKCLRTIMFMLDMNKFFEYKYEKEFITRSYNCYKEILSYIDPLSEQFMQDELSDISREIFNYIMNCFGEKLDLIREELDNRKNNIPAKINLKNKIRLKIYNHLKKRLMKKGLI